MQKIAKNAPSRPARRYSKLEIITILVITVVAFASNNLKNAVFYGVNQSICIINTPTKIAGQIAL